MILMGDTNCDLSSGSPDSNSRCTQNLYQLFSFKQLIDEPTRVTLTSSTLIDHIATTSIDYILESGVHKVSLSDHCMMFCKRKVNAVVVGGHTLVKSRSMKHCNEESFLADISHFFWDELVYRTDDTNTMVNDWSPLFSAVIEKHAPIREMRVSDKNSPWVNSELKYLMKSSDKLKKVAVKHKSQAMMSCYKKARNAVNNLNVSLKKQYFTNKTIEHKGNMKETWKITNELFNKRSKSTNITSHTDGDVEIGGKREISNTMNSYFCSVGEELAEKIDDSPIPFLRGDCTVNESISSFHFHEIKDQHVRDAMSKIKTSKGFDIDNISSYFLKLALPYINSSLTYIFNKSLEKGEFPTQWKMARVTPICKDGDKSVKNTYWSISVLPVVSRLFEKLVYNQLYQYLKENSLLASSQSGFRTLH